MKLQSRNTLPIHVYAPDVMYRRCVAVRCGAVCIVVHRLIEIAATREISSHTHTHAHTHTRVRALAERVCVFTCIGSGVGRYEAESVAGQRSAGTARKALHGGFGGCAKGCVRTYTYTLCECELHCRVGMVYSACKGTGAYDEINNFRATGHEPRGFAVFDTLLYYVAATPVTADPRRPPPGVWVAGPAAAGARTRPRTNTHARLSLAERRPVPPT